MENMFTETAKGKVSLKTWQAVLITIGLLFVGEMIVPLLLVFGVGLYLLVTGKQGLFVEGDVGNLLDLFSTIGLLATIAYWVKYVEKRPMTSLGFVKTSVFKELIKGWLIGSSLLSLPLLVLWGFGMVQFNFGYLSLEAIGLFLVYVLAWQIQSASEELLTRGYLLPVITQQHNKIYAVAVSSLLFSAFHLANSDISLVALINIALFGLLMCLYVIWKKNLWGVCGIHASWNCFQGSVFGIEVSGNSGYSSLITTHLKGSELLTGGQFGLEGSLLTMLLLSVACTYLYYKKIK